MNTMLLSKIEEPLLKKDLPEFSTGDTVSVTYRIMDVTIIGKKGKKDKADEKERLQTFTGLVIAVKGSGLRTTFTVRKISHGVGVERIFPLHSPIITKFELVKTASVRRSKIYYMRDRVGKAAMKVGKEQARGVSKKAKVVEAAEVPVEETAAE